ncbi:MAG: hypothetical protein ACTSU5_15845 [Promethearchaeota archaeon]
MIEVAGTDKPRVLASYFGGTKQAPVSGDLLEKLVEKHTHKDDGQEEVVYRSPDGRFFSTQLGGAGEEVKRFLVFSLGEKEGLETTVVNIGAKKAAVEGALGGDLKSALKSVFHSCSELDAKLRDPTSVKDYIIKKTNVLLDNGDFQRAQELIALAEKVPEKLSVAVKSGDVAMHKQNFKQAEKFYKQAADLAAEVDEREMEAALLVRAGNAKEFPNLVKNQKSAILRIEKPFGSLDKRVKSVYRVALEEIDKAIRISDKLEDDATVEILEEIASLTSEAREISRQLDSVDAKIVARLRSLLDAWKNP